MPPLRLKEIRAIRIRSQLAKRIRALALFNLAIDSKLHGCDLVGLQVRDGAHGIQFVRKAMAMQKKTQRPVQFELTRETREFFAAWTANAQAKSERYLFPSRFRASPHLSIRQYARIVPPMGRFQCARRCGLWNSHDAPHQGHIDLSSDEEFTRRAVAVGAHKA
jgi:hypothetical protein